MTHNIKASDFIVNFLLSNDINRCFCVTGGGAMHLNDSFGHNKDFITIYNHHEQACSMSAEGYSRTTGKPAVVCVTSGPGATNAITGVFGAWLDSIPMIVISGQMKQETTLGSQPLDLRYLGFQEADIIPIVSKITKYAKKIEDINELEFHLKKALFLANAGRNDGRRSGWFAPAAKAGREHLLSHARREQHPPGDRLQPQRLEQAHRPRPRAPRRVLA